MTLNRELQKLSARYLELYTNAKEQHITVEAARETLENLQVIDAEGKVWKIDTEGRFLAAPYLGGNFTHVDPSHFTSNDTPVTYHDPFAPPQTPTPNTPTADPFGINTNNTQANEPVKHFDPFQATEPYKDPLESYTRTNNNHDDENYDEDDVYYPTRVDQIKDYITTHKLATIIVVGVIIIAALAIWRTQTNQPEGTNIPTTNPTEQTTEQPGGDETDLPVFPTEQPTDTTTNPTTPPATNPPSSLPSSDDTTRVISAFTTADIANLPTQLAIDTDERTLTLTAAFFAGLDEAGLEINPGTAAINQQAPSTAVQQWDIVRIDNGQSIYTARVDWALVDGTWKLAALPTLP